MGGDGQTELQVGVHVVEAQLIPLLVGGISDAKSSEYTTGIPFPTFLINPNLFDPRCGRLPNLITDDP